MRQVISIRQSLAPKAPTWSLDLETSTGMTYILACESEQQQLTWAYHLIRAAPQAKAVFPFDLVT